jgi:UDP-2,3-diacylglucosamine pyrophosphatase LpxH
MEKIKIKILFISDTHLGNKNARTDLLLSVLKKYEFENLFIVGDFIDMTAMKKKFYWNQKSSTIIQKILKLSKTVNVVYLVGNHDYYVRSIIEEENIYLGKILICDEYIYETSDNKKMLIVHGDCFDSFVKTNPILYHVGDFLYELSIKINTVLAYFRALLGKEYWSLSSYLKMRTKAVLKAITNYKESAYKLLKEKGCDILLQGHTHSPEISKINDKDYINCGDFVESCSYVIETLDKKFELIYEKDNTVCK